MKKKYIAIAGLILTFQGIFAQITPEISSWILNTTNDLGYNNIPSNVLKVQYSDNNVYVTANCIPGYDIGPWAGNPNVPANQNFLFKITRKPVKNTGTATATGLGHIGVFINGVSIFNPKDAFSYNNKGVWFQNAVVVEGPSFDNCLGHPAPNGEYHHHLNPTCLYDDSLTTVHSPIVGYAFDGFPVYGPFAYAGISGDGGIVRMKTGYRKRNITDRTLLPDGSTAAFAGPPVNSQYPLGYYVEDFEYVPGLGDLDEHNGRYCKTPEYPDGMYCYFVTLDSNLVPEYPYLIGPAYYGTVQSGNTGPGSGHNTISETVVQYNGAGNVAETETGIISVYPNPGENVLHIFTGQITGASRLVVLNALGEEVMSDNNLISSTSYSYDMTAFASGIYLIQISSGTGTVCKAWIRN